MPSNPLLQIIFYHSLLSDVKAKSREMGLVLFESGCVSWAGLRAMISIDWLYLIQSLIIRNWFCLPAPNTAGVKTWLETRTRTFEGIEPVKIYNMSTDLSTDCLEKLWLDVGQFDEEIISITLHYKTCSRIKIVSTWFEGIVPVGDWNDIIAWW